MVHQLAQKLMTSPGARSMGLNISVISKQPDTSLITYLLEHLSEYCDDFGIRVFVHTFGEKQEDLVFQDLHGYICDEGEMDYETWMEKWAA
jgi:hypothetical protein